VTLEHALYVAFGYMVGIIAAHVWDFIRWSRGIGKSISTSQARLDAATKEAALLRFDTQKVKDLQFAMASARRLLTAAALTNHGLRISDCAVEAVGNDDYVLTFERPIDSHDVILTARRKDA